MLAKKRGLARKAGPPVHEDLFKQKTIATRPNQLGLISITEHRTDDGKL